MGEWAIYFISNCTFYQLPVVQHSCLSTRFWGSVLSSIVETRDQNSTSFQPFKGGWGAKSFGARFSYFEPPLLPVINDRSLTSGVDKGNDGLK